MIEKVLVAGDDRVGFGIVSQRHQIVVVGVSKQSLDLLRIVVLGGRFFDIDHDLGQLLRVEPLSEVPVGQGVLELANELGADDGLELEVKKGRKDQPWGTAPGATGYTGDQRACVDYKALQPAARRSRRASCTALTPSSIASSSESVLRSWTRRRVSRPRVILAIDSSSSRSLISERRWCKRSSSSLSNSTLLVGHAATSEMVAVEWTSSPLHAGPDRLQA